MILCRQRSYFCCSDAPSPSSSERLEHYEGTSSPTLRWSGLPISNTSAGTFLPRPPKSPSLNDWYWTSPAHRQRPSGEVRYCRAPLDTKRPRHIISTQKIEGDPLLRSVPNPFSPNNTTTLVSSRAPSSLQLCAFRRSLDFTILHTVLGMLSTHHRRVKTAIGLSQFVSFLFVQPVFSR